MPKVTTEEELAKALKDNEDTIEIEGNLAEKTIRLRATGKVAWAIAVCAIGLAVAAAIVAIPTGGTSEAVTAPAQIALGLGAVSALGWSTTASAISIALAAGGIAALKSLRSGYIEVERSKNRIVLKRV